MSGYVEYEHHGAEVTVKEELKGKHREHCLCYDCEKFTPEDRARNCPIANAVYRNCVEFDIVTPVWECKYFKEEQGVC